MFVWVRLNAESPSHHPLPCCLFGARCGPSEGLAGSNLTEQSEAESFDQSFSYTAIMPRHGIHSQRPVKEFFHCHLFKKREKKKKKKNHPLRHGRRLFVARRTSTQEPWDQPTTTQEAKICRKFFISIPEGHLPYICTVMGLLEQMAIFIERKVWRWKLCSLGSNVIQISLLVRHPKAPRICNRVSCK
jgi:hypothetical protein